jgi:ATP-dependent Lon protease
MVLAAEIPQQGLAPAWAMVILLAMISTPLSPSTSRASDEHRIYPFMPLRDIVGFPHTTLPLYVGREKSIRALEEAKSSNGMILLGTQKNATDENPIAIFTIGTLANVQELTAVPPSPQEPLLRTVKVLVKGVQRAKFLRFTDQANFWEAEALPITETLGNFVESEALMRSVRAEFRRYLELNPDVPDYFADMLQTKIDLGEIADTLAAHLMIGVTDRIAILEATDISERLRTLLNVLRTAPSYQERLSPANIMAPSRPK